MGTAKEIADLIQVSIEDDVDAISDAEGHAQRAWIDVELKNRGYKIIILQQQGLIDEDKPAEDDDEDTVDRDSDDMVSLMFDE